MSKPMLEENISRKSAIESQILALELRIARSKLIEAKRKKLNELDILIAETHAQSVLNKYYNSIHSDVIIPIVRSF